MLRKVLLTAVVILSATGLFADDSPYKVELIFDRLTAVKVVEGPGDTMEDLYGSLYVFMLKYPADTVSGKTYAGRSDNWAEIPIWEQNHSPSVQLGQGSSRVYNTLDRLSPASGLTYKQVTNLEFSVGGTMMDWEPLFSVNYGRCTACGSGARIMRLNDYKSQIDSIQPGTSKLLTIGGDNTFQLDWFEGDSNSSHVRAKLKIKITRD